MLRLNNEQRLAAEYDGPAKHLLILAGAGTGKTRTLIARVIFLVGRGVPPKNILLLTFTRRAAGEMQNRLKEEIGPDANRVMAGTFHHFCLKIMQLAPEHFGCKSISVIDADDSKYLLSSIRGGLVESTGNKSFPKVADIQQAISFAKNSCLDLEQYLLSYSEYDEMTIRGIVEIAQQYEGAKKKRHFLDYDDLLQRFADVVASKPKLADQISSRFSHILVDEFQDNNPLQYKILTALRNSSLYLVGDDAQSLYSFRGADFKTVHNFKSNTPDSEVLKLVENYRSYQEILDVSNWLLGESPINYNKYLRSARGAGAKPIVLDFDYRNQEASWIASDILCRQEADQPLSNIMILVRTAMSAKDLEAQLIERDIPYQFIGGTSLLEAAHVKDLLSLCRVAINRMDDIAWIRFLKLFEGIGDVTANKITREIFEGDPSIPVPTLIKRVVPTREDICESYTGVQNHIENPSKALQSAHSSLRVLMEAKYDRFEQREQELLLLTQMAERFKNLSGFLETYMLNPISKTEADQGRAEDKVRIITVHSAKGLEAPICYCLGVQPGLYPHSRSIGDEDKMEEERRVLYVALTRAQNELYITRSNDQNSTFGFPVQGGDEYYLLKDLPSHLVVEDYKGHTHSSEDAWLAKLDFL